MPDVRREGFALAGREIRGAAPYITEPLDTYATLSDEVGLDLRVSAAKPVELLSFWLERKPPEYREGTPFGHVLISDRRIVGAWVTTFAEGGPFSVRDRAAALAAPSARPPFPPRTRFPNGVNVAKSYDLATARAIAFKTGAGGNGTVTDPALIRAFAAALDATLPTTQAAARVDSPTRYYLHVEFAGSSVSLEYEASGGILSVMADGFSVSPGPAFASVITALH